MNRVIPVREVFAFAPSFLKNFCIASLPYVKLCSRVLLSKQLRCARSPKKYAHPGFLLLSVFFTLSLGKKYMGIVYIIHIFVYKLH